MSRVRLPAKRDGCSIAVGLDPPMGWFFQLYSPSSDEDDDGPEIWIDTRSNSEIVELLSEHGDLEDPRTIKVRTAIGLDFCPEEYWRGRGGL